MRTLMQDLHYGLRALCKSPGFTLVTLVSLALGIGINTAIFSFVNALLVRPVPVARDQDRVVWLRAPVSYPDYLDYSGQAQSFEGMAAITGTSEFSLDRGGEPELVKGEFVSANYFDVLGVKAALGRTFGEDAGRSPVPIVVIGHDLWRTRFDSDPGVVGRKISLNGIGFDIVGVTPENFIGTEVGLNRELWVPLSMQPALNPADAAGTVGGGEIGRFNERRNHWLTVFARLGNGVTRERAASELEMIARRVAETNFGKADPETLRAVQLLKMSGGMDPRDREELLPIAWVVMGVVALVLLIACVNVAGLLLARAAVRRRETAIRQALGAGRLRLVRQWLTESVMLGLAGGALGLLPALWGRDILIHYTHSTLLASVDFSVDYRVLAFTFVVAVATGIFFGLAPALQASRLDIVTALKTEDTLARTGSRRSRLRAAFVAAQLALSVVLLVCAGLFIRSLQNARAIDPGFRVERVLTVPLNLGLLRYKTADGRAFYRELLARVREQPEVESASLVRYIPLGFSYAQGEVFAEGREKSGEDSGTSVGFNTVGTGYFGTMGITLARGREFTDADRDGSPGVVVVNEALADALWPGEDPLGKRVSLEGRQESYLEVVGVTRDVKYRSLGERPRPYIYRPVLQAYEPRMTLVVRSVGDPQSIAGPLRQQIHALDTRLPVSDVRTLDDQFALSLFPTRVAAWVLGGFGLLALALGGIGVYGVVSYSIAQRTREIGVRMALGAQRSDILRLVMGNGLLVISVGLATGLLLAFVAGRILGGFLYGIGATDLVTFAGVPLAMGATALIASYLPARSATKVDPMEALRHE